ncbi:hypothetical protein [Streptomyces sp. NPDC046859]|uniref:hypothetical protein n=1 Tax=Streptomyces sp. NPDC046859 TaxID=3155734 RepID=UPI0033C086FE
MTLIAELCVVIAELCAMIGTVTALALRERLDDQLYGQVEDAGKRLSVPFEPGGGDLPATGDRIEGFVTKGLSFGSSRRRGAWHAHLRRCRHSPTLRVDSLLRLAAARTRPRSDTSPCPAGHSRADPNERPKGPVQTGTVAAESGPAPGSPGPSWPSAGRASPRASRAAPSNWATP